MPRWDNSSFIFKIRTIRMMGHSFSNSLNTACPNQNRVHLAADLGLTLSFGLVSQTCLALWTWTSFH